MTLQREAALATADPTWLDLREPADTRARDAGAGALVDALLEHLDAETQVAGESALATTGLAHRRARSAPGLAVVDVGAGTGANRRYLAPSLPGPQRWVCLDHDASALRDARHAGAQLVVGRLDDLDELLDELVGEGVAQDRIVVTGSALLDVLTDDQLAALAGALARHACPALFSLNVTGGLAWHAVDPDDDLVMAAFDAHQRRDGRPGPQAPDLLVRLMLELASDIARAHDDGGGATAPQVMTASTPWLLDASQPEFLERWLRERVEAAIEQEPMLAGRADAWLARRLGQLRSGELNVQVEHVDLLVLPQPQPPSQQRRGWGARGSG